MKKIIISVVTGVLIVSILLLIFITFSPLKTFQIERVMSGSMEPVIKTGSLIFIAKTPIDKISRDDVISFVSGGISVTHRVNKITKDGDKIAIYTKGDANQSIDVDPVNLNSIKGKVFLAIPYLGYFSAWVKTPTGFLLTVILPAVLIILNEIWNIRKAIEDSIKEKSKTLIPALILGTIVSLGMVKNTNAYFSAGSNLNNNVFSTARVFSTPTPTPKPDTNHHGRCEIKHEFFHNEKGHFYRFKVFNCHGFSKIKYKLRYDTDRVKEGVDGEEKFDHEKDDDFISQPVFLGRCSENEVCVDNENPRHFDLDLDFFKNDNDHEAEHGHSYHD